jgi:hypothetical protein
MEHRRMQIHIRGRRRDLKGCKEQTGDHSCRKRMMRIAPPRTRMNMSNNLRVRIGSEDQIELLGVIAWVIFPLAYNGKTNLDTSLGVPPKPDRYLILHPMSYTRSPSVSRGQIRFPWPTIKTEY